jgi:2-succinyl-5-enolpyruvyl-6-hydroxy-3-cyclohexene-1-carboxylate synthase
MVVVEELYRCGVDLCCLSPGARAIPLVLALEDHPAVSTRLFNDERSAAFWAQGAARAGRLPCLVCTSGTAAANYLPAVAEAALSGTPLLVLTTDRPFELHYAKANQTLPQRELLAPFVHTVFDVPAPEQRLHLHSLLANLDQAVFETQRTARPVHLNLAYRKPFVEEVFSVTDLPPDELDDLRRWQARSTPYCTYLQASPRLMPSDIQQLAERLMAAQHIVCVAGPLPPTQTTSPLRTLATRLGAPLFADINAGLRCAGACDPGSAGETPTPVLALYNLYLRGAMASLAPADLVLYFGDRLISEPLREYLTAHRPEFILCSSYPLRQDAVENEFVYPTLKIWSDPGMLAADLLPLLPVRQPTALTQQLAAYEARAQQRLPRLWTQPEATPMTEAQVIAATFQHIHDQSAVFLSASLIVREAEYCVPCLPKTLRVGANRGATGIDGVLSSGLGFGAGCGMPCTVLIGDQALLHDLNALSLVAAAPCPVYIMVINNHSGAIFHFFDLGATGERLRNPHPWSFRGVAENFRLAYVQPTSLAAFVTAYQEAQCQRRSTVFELVVDGEASVRLFQAASTLMP